MKRAAFVRWRVKTQLLAKKEESTMKKLLIAASIAALALGGTGVASAATITMAFNQPANAFTGGVTGGIVGNFDYNTVTNTYSNWNITSTNSSVQGGATANYTVASSTIDTSGSYLQAAATSATTVAFLLNGATTVPLAYREMIFKFSAGLNTLVYLGDTVTLITGVTKSAEGDQFNTASISGAITLTATAGLPNSPVPVPAAVWLFGSGIMGLVGMSRRKKADALVA